MPTDEKEDAVTTIAGAMEAARRWEPAIQAWAHLEDNVDGTDNIGPLAGVPFAVKDIIDVKGQPTRFGSSVLEEAAPAASDAAVVFALKQAGAVPIGKTRTTEFAFVDPTVTRNPYDPDRTPGGSSSGSGAVVGAGIVPFALGTQTAGSLCRPAIYCGAAAYKPGLGVLPTEGVAPLSRSFDAPGVIARDMAWLSRVFEVLKKAFDIPATDASDGRPLRLGLVQPAEQAPDEAMLTVMDDVVNRFRGAGHTVEKLAPSVPFGELIKQHRTVMLSEAARDLLPIVGREIDRLGPLLRAGLMEGRTIAEAAREDALGWIAEGRIRFWSEAGDFDLLLAFPVPGAAPVGLSTTGDQSYLTPWTALGGPLVALPAGLDERGLPLGVLLAAAPGSDGVLMERAIELSGLVPRIERARPPHS